MSRLLCIQEILVSLEFLGIGLYALPAEYISYNQLNNLQSSVALRLIFHVKSMSVHRATFDPCIAVMNALYALVVFLVHL